MHYLLLYLLALLAAGALSRAGPRRPLLVLMLPPLALDCAGNALLTKGSFRNTLSAQAWWHREHRRWKWTHRAIDVLFFLQPQHCRVQAEREARYGSVWAAWAADWRGQLRTVSPLIEGEKDHG